ncbi:adhesion G-protein coupled receptor F2 [Orycteropus afer afer]|uniref:Adhesion G-protein coupled receptor F2 n=1 Tax=Orycteropus afer afer TaxID=1230840 RepID=A0A8B6ZFM0_ORYAF|nr:adhesion G-protein coupled receptor F2 [Orycteropus afer afer]
MTHILWLYCLVFLLPTESCRTLCQAARESKMNVSARPQGRCDGVCNKHNSQCSQPCPPDTEGNMGFLCRKNKWHKVTDTCRTLNVFNIFEEDLNSIQSLGENIKINHYAGKSETITERLMQTCPKDLSCVVKGIRQSPRIPGNIAMIVQLLHNISTELKADVDETKMQSYSIIANHILNSNSISNWTFIPEKNSSCVLLHSVNSVARKLSINKHPIDIPDAFIHIKATTISRDNNENNFTFSMRVNDTGHKVTGKVFFTRDELLNVPSSSPVVSIAFPTLGAILEASLFENITVNGLILSVILPKELKNISLTFEKISKSEEKRTHCVGWHSLESRWDQKACQMIQENSKQAVCKCEPNRFFTSFSILMSPHLMESPILTYITYIGLGLSICSLILCLSIEAFVWRQVTKTEISYLRHLCIVNVAATLLMANVWFIVGSFLGGPMTRHNGCVVATFFVHFFYLSVFFWMLAKALLILYGILIVFHTLSKSVLVASLFLVGYGSPLVIAVITVAVTEPSQGYLHPEVCWLNWDKTKALLAFVVPALTIMVVNLITVAVVIVKTRQVATGSSMFQEVRAIVRISKNIAILTPLLGLTWGFGIAVVINDSSLVLHIIFSLLNAFQGFFILVFGTILDPKIREALKCQVTSAKWISRLSESLSLYVWEVTDLSTSLLAEKGQVSLKINNNYILNQG